MRNGRNARIGTKLALVTAFVAAALAVVWKVWVCDAIKATDAIPVPPSSSPSLRDFGSGEGAEVCRGGYQPVV
ncbi:hypothetical protein ABT294_50715, partial [Nonomuraea sp. NPDC000554]|uniref:hypothetical protein n=1 Tax=Nonomuraea sp. NPDC000554 TaxID=3154259 RepID=UPI00331DAE33